VRSLFTNPGNNKAFWITFGIVLFFSYFINENYFFDSLINAIFWSFVVWGVNKYFINKLLIEKTDNIGTDVNSEVRFLARSVVQQFLEDEQINKRVISVNPKLRDLFIEELETRSFQKDVICHVKIPNNKSEKILINLEKEAK